jgi:methionyl-tRNA formyltransferase
MQNNKIKIGFWGTDKYSMMTLDRLYSNSFDITFIVTQPDKPKGRKLVLTPPPVKVWGDLHNIPVFQPEKLRDESFVEKLKEYKADIFVVIAYGKIIPDEILNIPKNKSLNIHASLLPSLRGSCPIETAILNDDRNTGVTIIRMDSEMDHGPIVAKAEVKVEPWPPTADILGNTLVEKGSELLVSILPDWIEGKIKETEQDHTKATFTKKIVKEDGLIDIINGDPYKNYLKIQAYKDWPSAFFFIKKDNKDIRIKITEAHYENNTLVIEKVIPEGKNEISYKDLKI